MALSDSCSPAPLSRAVARNCRVLLYSYSCSRGRAPWHGAAAAGSARGPEPAGGLALLSSASLRSRLHRSYAARATPCRTVVAGALYGGASPLTCGVQRLGAAAVTVGRRPPAAAADWHYQQQHQVPGTQSWTRYGHKSACCKPGSTELRRARV